MKNKIILIIIVLCLTVLEIVNPIFIPILKDVFHETIIPYNDNTGHPNKKLIKQTIDFLDNVKKLRKVFIENSEYVQKAYNENGYTEFFHKYSNKNIVIDNRSDYSYTNNQGYIKYYLSHVYLAKKATEYMEFTFKYPTTQEKGLYVNYALFYTQKRVVKSENENYKIVVKLENNWYLKVTTTVDIDAAEWDKVRSTNKNQIWDGVPPLKYIIKPYETDKIKAFVREEIKKCKK